MPEVLSVDNPANIELARQSLEVFINIAQGASQHTRLDLASWRSAVWPEASTGILTVRDAAALLIAHCDPQPATPGEPVCKRRDGLVSVVAKITARRGHESVIIKTRQPADDDPMFVQRDFLSLVALGLPIETHVKASRHSLFSDSWRIGTRTPPHTPSRLFSRSFQSAARSIGLFLEQTRAT